MANTTTESIVREAPDVEAKRLGILEDATALTSTPLQLPTYNTAAVSPLQAQAGELAASGVGSFLPFINAGASALTGSASTLGEGRDVIAGGLSSLSAFPGAMDYAQRGGQAFQGMTQQYDPNSVQGFLNPYQSYVEDAIRRQYAQNNMNNAGAATKAGAFGGSRFGVQTAENQRNLGNSVGEAYGRDYNAAQQASMQNFQNQMSRQGQAAQGYLATAQMGGSLAAQQAEISRSLGLGIGSIGTEFGKLGVQQAALGELQSKLRGNEVNQLYQIGDAQQKQQQQVLDAQRQSTLQQMYEPYQRLGFRSDIYKGVPTSQQTLTSASAPSASIGSQIIGGGIAALGGAAALNKLGGTA